MTSLTLVSQSLAQRLRAIDRVWLALGALFAALALLDPPQAWASVQFHARCLLVDHAFPAALGRARGLAQGGRRRSFDRPAGRPPGRHGDPAGGAGRLALAILQLWRRAPGRGAAGGRRAPAGGLRVLGRLAPDGSRDLHPDGRHARPGIHHRQDRGGVRPRPARRLRDARPAARRAVPRLAQARRSEVLRRRPQGRCPGRLGGLARGAAAPAVPGRGAQRSACSSPSGCCWPSRSRA